MHIYWVHDNNSANNYCHVFINFKLAWMQI